AVPLEQLGFGAEDLADGPVGDDHVVDDPVGDPGRELAVRGGVAEAPAAGPGPVRARRHPPGMYTWAIATPGARVGITRRRRGPGTVAARPEDGPGRTGSRLLDQRISGESEDALADLVALDLRRAAGDGHGPVHEHERAADGAG